MPPDPASSPVKDQKAENWKGSSFVGSVELLVGRLDGRKLGCVVDTPIVIMG
jgi:hypothetical protein